MLATLSALMILTAASFAVVVIMTSISGSWSAISAALGYRQLSTRPAKPRCVVRRSRVSPVVFRPRTIAKTAAFS